MYFLRQWLRAKLGYQTKTIDSNFATLLVTESRSPKVQSSPVSCLFTCNGCQKVSGSHSSSHSSMTSEQKKKRKKMVVSKVNCEFDFFEIRGNARGIIDEKRKKMIRFQTNTKYSSINRCD